MNVRKQIISCEEIRKTDMVDYLSRCGLEPKKNYPCGLLVPFPLRMGKTPSFKINRKKNCWYDFKIGKRGNILGFEILNHDCTLGEFLKMVQE